MEPKEPEMDCYPYTFSPLLLFAQGEYFDKGHSNFNAVARFFDPVLLPRDVNMADNVLFDRMNMHYEELLQMVTDRCMLVTCCIDAHFTAFQVLPGGSCIYYDPMSADLQLFTGDQYKKMAIYLLLKCSYANSQHVQENKSYYTGPEGNPTRRMIYQLWQQINKLAGLKQLGVRSKTVNLNLDQYLLINNERDPRKMSTQQTGNTCYFQTYLFGLLCKVCSPALARDGSTIELQDVGKLDEVAVAISHFLLHFFSQDEANSETDEGPVLRPLTNSNFVVDFYRFREVMIAALMTQQLDGMQHHLPSLACYPYMNAAHATPQSASYGVC